MEDLLRPNLDSGMWQQMPPTEVGQLMAARAGKGEQPNGCSPFLYLYTKVIIYKKLQQKTVGATTSRPKSYETEQLVERIPPVGNP